MTDTRGTQNSGAISDGAPLSFQALAAPAFSQCTATRALAPGPGIVLRGASCGEVGRGATLAPNLREQGERRPSATRRPSRSQPAPQPAQDLSAARPRSSVCLENRQPRRTALAPGLAPLFLSLFWLPLSPIWSSLASQQEEEGDHTTTYLLSFPASHWFS